MRPSLAVARPPLDIAEMIPLSAAGRQPLFFFGTLMDLDVLTWLLERPIDLADLCPAVIRGFRRTGVAGASYPMLVPDEGAEVEGRLMRRAGARDIARINHYESEEYRAELHPVATGAGVETAAWLYLGLEHMIPTAAPWSLARWQAEHKAGFFAACDGWMSDFGAARRDRP
ncbi:MAG: gamma-glutamylcyclotransferase family protein [Geminicoccaceae bacterium]